MKIKEFNYTKKNGEQTTRNVLVLKSMDNYEDCIDLGHLTSDEQKDVFSIQSKYEMMMEPFIKKSFRRFSKEGMEIINEKNVEVGSLDEMVHRALEKESEKHS